MTFKVILMNAKTDVILNGFLGSFWVSIVLQDSIKFLYQLYTQVINDP